MDPATVYLLLGLLGGGSSIYGASQQASAQQAAQQLSAAQFEEQRQDNTRNLMYNFLSGGVQQGQQQAQQGLLSTQMDPFAQAKAQNGAQVRGSVQGSMGPGGVIDPSKLDMSALSSDNLNKSATNFYNYVGATTPNVPLGPNAPQASKQFQTQYATNYNSLMEQIRQYLGGYGKLPQLNGKNPTGANTTLGGYNAQGSAAGDWPDNSIFQG